MPVITCCYSFLTFSAMLEHDVATGGLSICLSHAGNASKLINVRYAHFATDSPRILFFCDQLSHPRSPGNLTLVLTLLREGSAWKNPT